MYLTLGCGSTLADLSGFYKSSDLVNLLKYVHVSLHEFGKLKLLSCSIIVEYIKTHFPRRETDVTSTGEFVGRRRVLPTLHSKGFSHWPPMAT